MKPTYITYKGKTQSITAWANEYKISSGALCGRIKSGWDIEQALTTPLKETVKRHEYKGKWYTVEELALMHGNISPKQPDTKKCRRCIYHGSLSGHGNANYGEIYCAYIEIMLKRRPCPPGEKCTEYEKGRSILRRTALKRFTG